jgi:hypothetical protein
MSLAACIRRCQTTTRWPLLGSRLLPDEQSQHRFLGLIRLEEQRVYAVPPEHEQNPRARADAANALAMDA